MTKKFHKLNIIDVLAVRKSGRHRVLRIKCKCGNIFERQARRLNERSTCVKCNRAGMSKFIYWSTNKLKEVIDNDKSQLNDGRDYQYHIDEIKEIFWEREDRSFDKMSELIA